MSRSPLLPKVGIESHQRAKSARDTNRNYVKQQLDFLYEGNPWLFSTVIIIIQEMEPEPGTAQLLLQDTAAETYHWLALQSDADPQQSAALPAVGMHVCESIEIAHRDIAGFTEDTIDLMHSENPLLGAAAMSYVKLETVQYYKHAELVACIYRALRDQAEINAVLNSA